MTELPAGWATARLDEVATVSGGIQKQPSRAPVRNVAPFLRVANVGSGVLDLRDVHEIEIDPDELRRYRLQPGDLLVVEGNGSASQIGRAARWLGEVSPCVHQNHLIRVRPGPAVKPQFLEYLWMSPAVREAVRAGAASTSGLYVLTTRKVSAVELSVAPTAEQERIVAAIQLAFSKLDAGEAGLRTARKLLKRLRDAVLAVAVTGRLVPQDPTDTPASRLLADLGVEPIEPADVPTLPSGWVWARLGSVAHVVGGVTKDSKRQDDPSYVERPYLRVANVQRGFLNLDSVATIRVPPEKAESLELRAGDVLFNEGGDRDKLGRGWVWDGRIDGCIHQNHVFRARLIDQLEPKLVSIWGNTFGQGWFERQGKQTTNLASINLKTLNSFPVPVAPAAEQPRIVAEIERQLSFIDACGRAVDASLARSAAMRRSVLKVAFEGRLVPQEPTDEPASVLLERIRAERAAAPKPTRRSRRTV